MRKELFIFFARMKRKFSVNGIRAKVRNKAFWFNFFRVALVLLAIGVLAIIFLFIWYAKDLPSPTRVVRREGYSSKVYDRNGSALYDIYSDAKREPVVWDDIPDYLKKATISVEDKSFYTHNGIDLLTPFRVIKNLFYFGKITGGSTLTQQLTRNVLLTTERSITRKIKEMILSIQIDAKYSKDEILLMYLNEAPYGGNSWGVGPAAEQYFGKAVKDLNLAECAILAGLPQLPSIYSPYSSTPTAYVDRTKHVLSRMVEDGIIDQQLADSTMDEVKNYQFAGVNSTVKAPHFVFWIKELLTKKYGADVVENGGLKIITTLDLELQEQAEKIVSEQIDASEKLGISNGAALVLDSKNGQVLAMVGSRDYFSTKTDGNFNMVTQALRQPGSAIKPVTYLAGLQKGMTASTMFMDTPVTFAGTGGQPDYKPENYNGKFTGPISIRNALGNSINTVAVKILANVGLKNMLTLAYNMGITTLEPTDANLSRFGLAVTLGGAEVKMIDLASAYTAFTNGGISMQPVGILKVEDKNGRVLEEYKAPDGKKVMSPQEAFIISNILSDNSAREMTFGAVNNLQISGYQVAAKTGTTNDKKDNWTIGWTPNLLTAVWVGNNDNTPMGKVASGVSGAAPIWKKIMAFEVPKREKQDFPIPSGIIQLDVDAVSGYLAHDGFASKKEYFIDGTQQSVADPIHVNLKVCKDASGLANLEDVSNGNYDTKEYFIFKEDDPVSTDGVNRFQAGIDKWISEQSNSKYLPPTNYCRAGGQIALVIDYPGDQSTVSTNFNVKVTTSSVKKVTEVKMWIDGSEYKTWSDKPYETSVSTLADGPHKIRFKATDKDGNTVERETRIGVNTVWDYSPSPTITLTPTPTASPNTN